MTLDRVVMTPRDFDVSEVLNAMSAATAELPGEWRVGGDRSERVVVIQDPQGRPAVFIGPTRRVLDPWEQAKRWSLDVGGEFPWWTEIVSRGSQGAHVAAAVAEGLLAVTGGIAGVMGAVPQDEPFADPEYPDAPVDVVGETEAVLVQSRPLVALGPWLTHVLLWATDQGKTLVLLTPPSVVLSPAVERLTRAGTVRWVIDDEQRTSEAWRNVAVRWDGSAFVDVPGGDPVPVIAQARDAEWNLSLDVDTTLAYQEADVGGLLERCVAALSRGPVAAVGLLEPVEASWDPSVLRELARSQSPRQTQVIVRGAGFEGVCSLVPQPVGLVERTELLLRAPGAPYDEQQLTDLGRAFLAAGAQLALLGYRLGSSDLVAPSYASGPLLPGLIAVAAARFPSLSGSEVGAVAEEFAVPVDQGWVIRFPTPENLSTEAAQELLARRAHVMALLARHDAHVLAERAQQGTRDIET